MLLEVLKTLTLFGQYIILRSEIMLTGKDRIP